MAFVYEFDWIRSSSRVCVSERNPDASMCIAVKKKKKNRVSWNFLRGVAENLLVFWIIEKNLVRTICD